MKEDAEHPLIEVLQGVFERDNSTAPWNSFILSPDGLPWTVRSARLSVGMFRSKLEDTEESLRMKKMIAAAAMLATVSSFAFAAGTGLQVGEPVSAFYVKDVTGPAAGNKLCYRCRFGDRPVVTIFTRDVNDSVTSLIKKVDDVVGKHQDQDMKAFVVLLTDEPDSKESLLKKVAADAQVSNTPLTTFDSSAGPAPYKLSHDADVTVMMWVDGTLKVNETFKGDKLTQDQISAVLAKTKQILN
jgi:hypothetical protein